MIEDYEDAELGQERRYTAQEVGDFQTSEAELVSKPLRAEVKRWKEMAALLAETLRFYQHASTPSCDHCEALAAYEALAKERW